MIFQLRGAQRASGFELDASHIQRHFLHNFLPLSSKPFGQRRSHSIYDVVTRSIFLDLCLASRSYSIFFNECNTYCHHFCSVMNCINAVLRPRPAENVAALQYLMKNGALPTTTHQKSLFAWQHLGKKSVDVVSRWIVPRAAAHSASIIK